MVSKTTKLTQMGRRSFLEKLAGLGLSTEAIRHMTKDRLEKLTGDPTEEVPRIGGLKFKNPELYEEPPYPQVIPEREPEYYTISKDKFTLVETAFDAAQNIQEEINELDNTGLVSASVQISSVGRRKEYTVNVKRTTKIPQSVRNKDSDISPSAAATYDQSLTPEVTLDQLKGELPDTARGRTGSKKLNFNVERDDIEINFTESVEWDESEPCNINDDSDTRYYDEKYRYEDGSLPSVPAACGLTVDPGWSGYDGNPTLGPRVLTGASTKFLTSAHGAFESGDDESESPDDAIGRTVEQGDSGWRDTYKIGEIEETYWDDDELDVAVIDMTEEYSAGNKLASETASTTNGELSMNRLGKDYLRDKGKVYKQGRRTGRCSHLIHDYDPKQNTPDRIEVVRENKNGGGNSGAPYWGEINGEKRVGAMHRAGNETICGDCRRPIQIELGICNWIGDIESAVGGVVY